jgi:hypothetical protein
MYKLLCVVTSSLIFTSYLLPVQAFEVQDLKQKAGNIGSRFSSADQKYRSCKKNKTPIKACTSNYKQDLVKACDGLSGIGLTTCLSTAEGKKRGAQLNNLLSK